MDGTTRVPTPDPAARAFSDRGSFHAAMTTGTPLWFAADAAPRALGIIPPAMTPASINRSMPAPSIRPIRAPCSSLIPATSVSRTSAAAPMIFASPVAASSALTFSALPPSSIPIDATTGRNPALSSAATSRPEPPVIRPTRPRSPMGCVSTSVIPPSPRQTPTAGLPPAHRFSAPTSALFTCPARTATTWSICSTGVTRSPSMRSVVQPSRDR